MFEVIKINLASLLLKEKKERKSPPTHPGILSITDTGLRKLTRRF